MALRVPSDLIISNKLDFRDINFFNDGVRKFEFKKIQNLYQAIQRAHVKNAPLYRP